MKNPFDELISRLGTTEERLNKLENTSELKFEDKNNLKNNTFKHWKIFQGIISKPEAEGKNKADEIFEVTIDKNFPK